MAESFTRAREYNTPQYLIAADTLIEAGDIVAVERAANSNKGYLIPASAGAGKSMKVKGIATKTVDNRAANTATTGLSGLVGGAWVPVETSASPKGLRAHKVVNDTGTPVVQADVGGVCYVKDSKTVTGSSTNAPTAAEVFRIDADGNPFVIFNQ
jgi:hypothetical protein